MKRDYETKGEVLIRIGPHFEAVSASNFKAPVEDLTTDEELREEFSVTGGPFCLVPWELGIPF